MERFALSNKKVVRSESESEDGIKEEFKAVLKGKKSFDGYSVEIQLQVKTENYDVLEELVGTIGSERYVVIKQANKSLDEF